MRAERYADYERKTGPDGDTAPDTDLRIQLSNARMPLYEKYNQNRGIFLRSGYIEGWKRAGTTNVGCQLETDTGEYSASFHAEDRNYFPSTTRAASPC